MFKRLFFSLLVAWMPISALASPERWKAEGWATDFTRLSVEVGSIMSGGPPRDGIPPIDDPKFLPVGDIGDLSDRDPVIGLQINGDARAYPLRVMMWHEIVNDDVGGEKIAVTYCPLCNAAIVFDATVEGKDLSFGTTGKLRNSDLIMYDRQTESWWQQFSGEAIAGEYLGTKLEILPARLESWKDFKTRHPNGQVLVPNNAGLRDYGRNPYVHYDISARPFLFTGSFPEGIDPMARVVVIRRSEKTPLIVAMSKVREARAITIGGFKVQWREGQASALHDAQIAEGRDVGSVIVKRDATGDDVPYDVTFAFVAHAFHPQVEIKK